MHQTNLIITLIDPIGPSINLRQCHMAHMVHIIWEIFYDSYESYNMTHISFMVNKEGSIWNSFCNTNVIRLKSIHLISLIINVVKHHSIGIIT